jgi:hypothetical protein
MHSQIFRPLEVVWHHHLSQIEEALDESIRALQNLLRLDEYHRHGHEEEQLKETLGPFGSSSLNLSSLSEVLSKSGGGRGLKEERLNRIQRLLDDLEALRATYSDNPESFPSADINEDEAAIHEKAEAHLNQMASIFRNLRMTQLEIRAKYDPQTHDAVFGKFTWRHMSPSELGLCPPFVITAEIGNESGPALRKILSLLESRKPFKIFALRSGLKKTYSPTADTSVPANLAIEMIPLAMRGIYFVQTCEAASDYDQRLFKALTSPRPGLISLLAQKADESEEAFAERARRAMRARAFPAMVYDPDLAPGFVSCFDLAGNPEPEEDFTFAHYAADQDDFQDEFSPPDPATSLSDLVTLSGYLHLSRRQRVGKVPVIKLKDTDGNEQVKVVSQALVTQTSDLIHLWKTLLEISGVDNPYVKHTQAHLQQEYGAQQKALIADMQEEMDKQQAHREQVAVASAVQRIVAHFTEVDPSVIDLQRLIAGQENS